MSSPPPTLQVFIFLLVFNTYEVLCRGNFECGLIRFVNRKVARKVRHIFCHTCAPTSDVLSLSRTHTHTTHALLLSYVQPEWMIRPSSTVTSSPPLRAGFPSRARFSESTVTVSLRSPHLLSLSRTHRHTTRALLCQGSPFAQPLLVPLAGPHLHSTLTSFCSSLSCAFSLSLSLSLSLSRADSSRLQGQSVSL